MASTAMKTLTLFLLWFLLVARGQSLETSQLSVLVGVFYGPAVQPAPGATLEAEFEDGRSQAGAANCRHA
jgi:hypothetical protein